METRKLGNSDIDITPLIFGTWQAGKRGWVGVDDDEVIQAMQAALEAGITTFDTAEVYGLGQSERLIGRFMQQRPQQAVIATKYFPLPWRWSQQSVADALTASLDRLHDQGMLLDRQSF